MYFSTSIASSCLCKHQHIVSKWPRDFIWLHGASALAGALSVKIAATMELLLEMYQGSVLAELIQAGIRYQIALERNVEYVQM